MTEQKIAHDRDEVLFAFHQECSRPTVAQVVAWAEKYPEFADDIRAHAAIARDWSDTREDSAAVADERLLNHAHSRALNLIFEADQAEQSQSAAAHVKTFQQFFAMRGVDVPAVAKAIGIARGVIADVVSGHMIPPVGRKLVAAFTQFMVMTQVQFEDAFELARERPVLGRAKSDQSPSIVGVTYRQSVETSGMPLEQQRFWLEDD